MTCSISMPEAEATYLQECYAHARVILEYGSGGSTELAAQMSGKLIMSIESDRDWARSLRQKIAAQAPLSQVIIQHVDIGQTGSWGRAVDNNKWQSYHRYPNAIWEAPFFRHPDVILIDGRFRTACLMTAILRITRPLTVLFDDYVTRPKYQLIEQVIRPKRLVGRMAEFNLQPGLAQNKDIGFIIEQFFQATFAQNGNSKYEIHPDQEARLELIRNVTERGQTK